MKEVSVEIPKAVREKAEAAKRFIEKKYSLNQIKAEEKAENWRNFQEKLKSMNLTTTQEEAIKKEVIHQQMEQCRRKRQKISKKNFQSLAIIGRGAFGEVRLCKEVKTGKVVAIKCLKKKQMIKKNQQAHLRDERNVLVDGSDWIVKLLYSFQDQAYLYLVMEFLPGGDLMTLLIERNVITEAQARFYAAETIIAIQSVHKLNYIHRDLKPDNILIDSSGHIKLSDFGLCKQADIGEEDQHDLLRCRKIDFKALKSEETNHYNKMIGFKKRNRKLAYSAVGTPDYIAPEMLTRKGYSETVDWWSLGIMIYEMLVGYAPFSADTNEEIYYKIQNHEDFLFFPPEVEMSEEVINLISRLLIDEPLRLGRNGALQIKKHPWFKGIDWKNIRKTRPPFVPEVKNQIDTRYFDKYQQKQAWLYNPLDPSYKKDFNFVGYTYKDDEENKGNEIMERAIEKAQKQKKEEIQKEQQWLDMLKNNMKKKKKVNLNDTKPLYISKKVHTKYHNFTSINQKSELYTDRSRSNLKSKSPLGQRDSNISRKGTSRSPLQTQKSNSYLRKTQGASSTTFFHQTMDRKSLHFKK